MCVFMSVNYSHSYTTLNATRKSVVKIQFFILTLCTSEQAIIKHPKKELYGVLIDRKISFYYMNIIMSLIVKFI